ncbi:MAG: ABC transporter ATP-binding protein [Clostridia bacterium]|nr:ABC transporter ATP-binding protein [Clostridia bacterium]
MAEETKKMTFEELLATLPCKNKEVPAKFNDLVKSVMSEGETIYFYVISDVVLGSRYGESFVAVTSEQLVSYDEIREEKLLTFKISDIEKAEVKRMYGNALFRIKTGGKIIELNKCSYSVTENFDNIAQYINDLNEGKDRQDLIEAVREAYEKRQLYCPKCGARLPYKNAPCIKCADKKKILGRILGYVKPHILLLIVALIMAVITTITNLVPPLLTARLVDGTLVNVADLVEGTPEMESRVNELFSIVLFLFIINTFQNIVGAFRGYILRTASERITNSLKTELYTKAQYLPIKYYDKTSTGSVISRINGDTANLNGFIMRISQEVLTQAIQLVGIVVVMVSMNPVLSLLSLLPIPIVVVSAKIFSKFIHPYYYRIWKRGAKINSILADTLPGIKVVKAFTSEEKSINNFTETNKDLISENLKTAKISSIYNSATGLVMMMGSIVIWGLGGYMVLTKASFLGSEALTAGGLVAFINYMWMFYNPVQFFVSLNETFISAFTSAERVFEVLDAEPEEDFGRGNIPEGGIQGKIEFKNVSFSYEKGKRILSNVNFVIEPGEIVGIVGTTGSGKSTVVNLLMRYYDNYEGDIFIDGDNIKNIDLQYYRSSIGYVLQEPLLFKDTVYRNIAHSDPTMPVEDVIYAAQVANAHTFITKLPDSYDTMLGERGVGLSGGERQRISIARAVLKDPSILILDEATSAVDSETESIIQEAIERIINGRTTIMIAHRLSTLKKADKIIVVDEGKIAEMGSHNELMEKRGKYYKLVKIQSLASELGDNGVFEG